MEWFRELTQEQATVIVSTIGTITAVVVAFLAASLATKKDTRIKRLDRQFSFRDRREREYSEFILSMNNALQIYFENLELGTESVSFEAFRAIEGTAQELDTASMRLRIAVPDFVAHAVLNLNGHIQNALLSLRPDVPSYSLKNEFEIAKQNMLRSFEVDLDLIEDSRDRGEYRNKVLRENKRYKRQTQGSPK
ncbi:hypothetical protein [Celeribacter marinus]|uniref:hypothetical protein n=1 Tax=Celeribacter marinus TaxID=1397108 RepID=UPI003F6B5274